MSKMIHKYTAHVHEPQNTEIVLKIIVKVRFKILFNFNLSQAKIRK